MSQSNSSVPVERKSKLIPPFDPQLRYTVSEAAAYLKTSRMTIYKLLHSGALEGIKEDSRTFVSGRSIAAKCAPPEPTRWVPNVSRRSMKALSTKVSAA